MTNDERNGLEWFKSVLDKSSELSESDKKYLIANSWTFEQIPEIKNTTEYQQYVDLHERLTAQLHLPAKTDPQFGLEFKNKMQSPEGMFLNGIGARIIEWESRTT